MEEWEDEPLICTNCEGRINPEWERYLRYEDRNGNYLVLCSDCLDEHIKN